MIKQCTKEQDDSIFLSKNLGYQSQLLFTHTQKLHITVGYATTNNVTMNECYNKQFLSIKSGCYNEHKGILSANVAHTCA